MQTAAPPAADAAEVLESHVDLGTINYPCQMQRRNYSDDGDDGVADEGSCLNEVRSPLAVGLEP